MGSEGVAALAATLESASGGFGWRLHTLDLQDTGLTAEGGLALARLLRFSPSLPSLNTLALGVNSLGLTGIRAIVAAVKRCPHPRPALARVELYMNALPSADLAFLQATVALAGRTGFGLDVDDVVLEGGEEGMDVDGGAEAEGSELLDRVFIV